METPDHYLGGSGSGVNALYRKRGEQTEKKKGGKGERRNKKGKNITKRKEGDQP